VSVAGTVDRPQEASGACRAGGPVRISLALGTTECHEERAFVA
jgi:hypothetical protein